MFTSSLLASLTCNLLHFSCCLLIRIPLLPYALMGGANFTSNTLVSAVQTGFRKLNWNTGILEWPIRLEYWNGYKSLFIDMTAF